MQLTIDLLSGVVFCVWFSLSSFLFIGGGGVETGRFRFLQIFDYKRDTKNKLKLTRDKKTNHEFILLLQMKHLLLKRVHLSLQVLVAGDNVLGS